MRVYVCVAYFPKTGMNIIDLCLHYFQKKSLFTDLCSLQLTIFSLYVYYWLLIKRSYIQNF